MGKHGKAKKKKFSKKNDPGKRGKPKKLSNEVYEKELARLHAELVKLGKRSTKGEYDDEASIAKRRFVPAVY